MIPQGSLIMAPLITSEVVCLRAADLVYVGPWSWTERMVPSPSLRTTDLKLYPLGHLYSRTRQHIPRFHPTHDPNISRTRTVTNHVGDRLAGTVLVLPIVEIVSSDILTLS